MGVVSRSEGFEGDDGGVKGGVVVAAGAAEPCAASSTPSLESCAVIFSLMNRTTSRMVAVLQFKCTPRIIETVTIVGGSSG